MKQVMKKHEQDLDWKSNLPWYWLCLSEVHGCWFINYIHRSSQLCSLLVWSCKIKIEDTVQISFKHVSLWWLFFDPHQSTHKSNIGVRLDKQPKNTRITYMHFEEVFWRLCNPNPPFFCGSVIVSIRRLVKFGGSEHSGQSWWRFLTLDLCQCTKVSSKGRWNSHYGYPIRVHLTKPLMIYTTRSYRSHGKFTPTIPFSEGGLIVRVRN